MHTEEAEREVFRAETNWFPRDFASVVGGTLAVVMAFTFGFRVALCVAALVYLLALVVAKGRGWEDPGAKGSPAPSS